MRKSKKRLIRSGLAGLLIAALAAGGGTLAYLTDTETANDTFTVGKVKIDLEEPNYPGNDSDEVKTIVPNQTVAKDPQIENTGNNEAIVYLKVEVPQEEYTELGADNVPGEKKLQDLFALKDISNQWELIRTETTTTDDGKTKTSYIYAYKKPLGKGETTDKLFQKVQMKNSMESDLAGKVEDIIVTAYAIQSTDVSDISLTPAEDGTLGKDVLDQVYTVFLNQSKDNDNNNTDNKNDKDDQAGGNNGESEDPSVAETTLSIGTDFSNAIHALTNGDLSKVTTFQKSATKPSEAVLASAQNVAQTGAEPVYLWLDNNQDLKYWTSAKKVYMNANSSCIFWYFDKDANSGYGCENLKDLSALADWDSSKVTSLNSTFRESAITDTSVFSNLDISNVQYMNYTFRDCKQLVDISGLSNWDTSRVDMTNGTFRGCANLTNVSALSKWNTQKSTNMSEMFQDCSQLTDLSGLSNWNTSKVWWMSSMFAGCSQLKDLSGIANWDTSGAGYMRNLFEDCTSLTSTSSLSNWSFSKSSVVSMDAMFCGCSQLSDLSGLSNWSFQAQTSKMFKDCASLTNVLSLSNWTASNLSDMDYMFSGCTHLSDLSGLSNWGTFSNIDMSYMFSDCTALTNVSSLSKWDVTKVKNTSHMFSDCTGLTTLSGLSSWRVYQITDMTYMFSGCTGLTNAAGPASWYITSYNDTSNMFLNTGITTYPSWYHTT